MRKITNRVKGLCLASAVMAATLVGGIASAWNSDITNAETAVSSYIELYSPTNQVNIAGGSANFTYTVEDNAKAPSGKGLAMNYTACTDNVSITIPMKVQATATGFQGLAMWVDVPETADEYSFTMYIEKQSGVWQTMELGSELTLVDENGTVTSKNSLWKRQELNGFRGWVMMPASTYKDSIPEAGKRLNVIFMIEYNLADNFVKTENAKVTLGSFGYYNDFTGFLFEKAGAEAAGAYYLQKVDGYIAEIDKLTPKSDTQKKLRNQMLVYFSNIKENFATLEISEQVEIAKGLYDDYYRYMEQYLYGDIKQTEFLMSFAIMSDTHFTETWVNDRFVRSLADAKKQDPNLASVFVLGDLSNEGVLPDGVAEDSDKGLYTELDNYYDWLDTYQKTYLNASGEEIPITSVMGNHDVRGSSKFDPKYPEAAYQPGVNMYLEREPLAKEAGSIQFDTWINGFHFIFLNTDKYHSDDCYLSNETLLWLDETLAENEDGRPIFVMVHQPVDNIHEMEGATMTFKEVIARHPSAIVTSGHAHSPFGTNKIIQEGEGTYINQPAMVLVQEQYYFVEVYEGGVIYRAREVTTDSWHISNDVAVANEDRSNNVLFNADGFNAGSLNPANVTASVVAADSVNGKALKLVGDGMAETVSLPMNAMGAVENYAGYALYMQSASSVQLTFNGNAVKANATYYAIENGAYVEKTADANGKITANGWVVIPKESINGNAAPSKSGVLGLAITSETVELAQVGYYFDKADFLEAATTLSYVFYNDDGSVIKSGVQAYGSALTAPTGFEKADTDAATYTFLGWDLNGDGTADSLPTAMKGNVSAKAVYATTAKKYTYTYYAADGTTVISSERVDYGTKLTAPAVDGLFGWDLDGDGAAESLPETLMADLTAVAILGEPPYENAEVIYDPAMLSSISISTAAWSSGPSTISVNTLPATNANAPTGKVAQFTHPGTQTAGTWVVYINTPYAKTYENFQGYAIWVDVAATTEEYTGGLNVNSERPSDNHKWALVDLEGNVTKKTTKYTDVGAALNLGKGFTGWVLIDKSSWADSTQAAIVPSATGNLQFRFAGGNRTTPFTMSIGQVLAFSDMDAIIAELSAPTKSVLEYNFSDGNGHVYKAGQIAAGESIVVPVNPVHEDKSVFFAGWDINRDGKPDALPADGKITDDLNAVAVFCHVDAFETFHNGGASGWTKTSNPAALTLTITEETYAASPTGKAVHLDINNNGATNTGWNYAMLNLPANDTAKGVAFWMDASSVDAFTFCLWKNWINKSAIGDGGDYVYLLSHDGAVTTIGGWRQMPVPANFKGWVVIPLTVFINNSTIYPGDYLRLGFEFGTYNPAGFSADIWVGEGVLFNCTPQMFMSQIDKRVYGFKDYDDSFISCGILEAGQTLPVPANPTREGWNFLGWDIDGDGAVDTLPTETGRNFQAKAVYNRTFTYKFVDQNGVVLLEKTADYNALILPPFHSQAKHGYHPYIVDFGTYEEGMRLVEDVTFTVTIATYTYQFVADGVVVAEGELLYGAEIQAPEAPEKEGYTFEGWMGYTEGMTIEGDVSFVAVYEENTAPDSDSSSGSQGGDSSSDSDSSSSNQGGNDNSGNSADNSSSSGAENKPAKFSCMSSISGSFAAISCVIALAGVCLGRKKED